MKLDYSTVCQVKINMLDYINEILYTFDKGDTTGGGTKSSASIGTIFKVYKDYKIYGKTICGVSSLGGKNIICYQVGQYGHLHHNLIHHGESNRT